MTDQVSENQRRARYVVTDPAGQDRFDISFPVSSGKDKDGNVVPQVAVYLDGAQLDDDAFVVDYVSLSVALDTPAAQGTIVIIEGRLLVKRTYGYPLRGGLDSSRLNDENNAIIQMLQEMRRDIDRCMALNKLQEDDVDRNFPLYSPGKIILWDPLSKRLLTGADASQIESAQSSAIDAASSAIASAASAEVSETWAMQAKASAEEASSSVLGDIAGLSVLGRAGNTTGAMAAITAATDGQVLKRTGSSLSFGLITAANLSSGEEEAGKVIVSAGGGAVSWESINVPPLLDEDDMVSNSDESVPSQQSVKAYVDASVSGGGWESYTPTITGFGSVTNVNFYYKKIGDSIIVRGRFTSGSSTTSIASITLPTGFTTANTYPSSVTSHVGAAARSSASASGFHILTERASGCLYIGNQSTALAGLSKAQGSSILGSGESLSFTTGLIEITGA